MIHGYKIPFCCSKFPWARDKFLRKLTIWACAVKKFRQPWSRLIVLHTSCVEVRRYFERRIQEGYLRLGHRYKGRM
jgi:hypothetical protein